MKIVMKDRLTGVIDLKELVFLKFLGRLRESKDPILLMINEVVGTVCWELGTDFFAVRAYKFGQS